MKAKDLKNWKESQQGAAVEIVNSIVDPTSKSIKDAYPEFELGAVYTTSLDPHVPVWVLLPFFEKIVVGILPYLKTEEDFVKHYGVTTRQMLRLREMSRVELRILFPSRSTVPQLMNTFFSLGLPSTIRDKLLVERILGPSRLAELRSQFKHLVGSSGPRRAVDGLSDTSPRSRRAYNTCEAVYCQLHAHGYVQAATDFELVYARDANAGIKWLELCRLFLIGPIHYSLMGIHSVPDNAPDLPRALDSLGSSVINFPSELGRILVDTLKLVQFPKEPDNFNLQDCLAIYPDFEEARRVLFQLRSAIEDGIEERLIQSVDDLRGLLRRTRGRMATWMRFVRLVLATGISTVAIPLHWTVGLLSGLGFRIATEFWSDKVNRVVDPIARKLPGYPPEHLTLLVKLEDKVKRHFQIKAA